MCWRRVELAADDSKAAESQLAKGLQECPGSGQLWAQAVGMAARPQRKSKSAEGLKRCDNDPHIICAVAQLFLQERKIERARDWFNRCVLMNRGEGTRLRSSATICRTRQRLQQPRHACSVTDHHLEVPIASTWLSARQLSRS